MSGGNVCFTNIPDGPYSKALDLLASGKGWGKVLPLVPEHSKSITDLLKALKLKPRVFKAPAVQTKRKVCGCCHLELPHRTRLSRSTHSHYAKLVKVRRNRWSKYPEPKERSHQTGKARATFLAALHDRWVAALQLYDPVRTSHLLETQGRSAVVALWRTLPLGLQRRLRKAVPPPPRRLYKGEILVRKGLKAPRQPRLDYLKYHAKEI